MNKKKIEHLVVDTSAFIQNAPIQEIATNFYTIQEVVDEITNKRQLRRLCVLPYDLNVKDVFSENIIAVTEFSKKTGDYKSLSATDIKVMALCLQLEKECVGADHIRNEPSYQKSVNYIKEKGSFGANTNLPGFYFPKKKKSKDDQVENENDKTQNNECEPENNITPSKDNDKECSIDKELSDKFGKIDLETIEKIYAEIDENFDDVLTPVKEGGNDFNEETHDLINSSVKDDNNEDEWITVSKNNKPKKSKYIIPLEEENIEYESENESEDSDYEDGDWITPENVQKAVMQTMGLMGQDIEDKSVIVACMTKDFAMQNVLKQMNLNVSVLNGQIIKQLRTYIFRCYSCFKTTSIMTNVFCPKCGYATLKRVCVSVDEEGKQIIHINIKRPISKRGKKFSLPTPQGGKHANNPILAADQPIPDQRPSRLARAKTNVLADDYIAGYSPFVTRDVYSRSAQLGIKNKPQQIKHWMRKNPNEARKKRK